MGTGKFSAGGQRAVEMFLVASCYGNRDKLRPDGSLSLYADFTPFSLEYLV